MRSVTTTVATTRPARRAEASPASTRASPYSGGKIGSWGFDARSRVLIDPAQGTDIMGYCNSKWISDYTYNGLTDRVAAVNAAFEQYVAEDQLASYRVLLLDSEGPRWSFPITTPTLPFGEGLSADVLDAAGATLTKITVHRTEIGDNQNSYIVLVPEPKSGWTKLRIAGWPAIDFADGLGVPMP